MGSAVSSYARLPSASSTKMWRGTLRIRSSTARLVMPCSRSRCTSRSRVRAEVMPMPESLMSGMNTFQPALQIGQRGVACQIDLQGRHGDETLSDGLEVGAGTGILLRSHRPDPIHRSASRILRAHDRLGTVAIAEASAAK